MDLTQKQIQIVLFIAAGYTSDQIAELLSLSPLTIENHRKVALKTSGYCNWSQFMAVTGMSGQLKKWKDGYERLHEAISGREKNKSNEAE